MQLNNQYLSWFRSTPNGCSLANASLWRFIFSQDRIICCFLISLWHGPSQSKKLVPSSIATEHEEDSGCKNTTIVWRTELWHNFLARTGLGLNLDRQQKFHFRVSQVWHNGKKAICMHFLFSNHFQLSHHLLFIHPQIFRVIYCLLQVRETFISFFDVGLAYRKSKCWKLTRN